LLCGLTDSIAWLIFMRMIQGIGASFIFSTGMAILAAAYPPASRGKALGYSTASTYVGLSAGPVLGGLISFHFGWRIVFRISAILGFAVFFIACRFSAQSGIGGGRRTIRHRRMRAVYERSGGFPVLGFLS